MQIAITAEMELKIFDIMVQTLAVKAGKELKESEATDAKHN